MTTAQDLINKVALRLEPTQRDIVVTLGANSLAGATSLTYTDTSPAAVASGAIQIGTILSLDLELFLVTGAPTATTIPVSPGYRGSIQAAHTSGILIHVNPIFSDFQILQAINDDLDSLCSIENGLWALGMLEVTYNQVYIAYDLTDVNTGLAISNYKDGIALRYKTPWPDRKYIGIPEQKWEVVPIDNDTNFPSGYQLNLMAGGYPGFPVEFVYKQGFNHLVNYTDNVQSVTGLPSTCNDLPPLGAILILVAPREVRRNDPGSQPDSRLAPETPPAAIMNSVAGVDKQRERRITEEAANLAALVSRYRRRY